MPQAWRPEKIDEFVSKFSVTEGLTATAFISIMDATLEDMEVSDVSVGAILAMAHQWGELSPWERLNAFLRIRGLVEGLTKKTFEQLNAEARAADESEE